MGVTHAAGRPGRAFQYGCAAINRKLGLTVEDDEHLLTAVMKVMTDSTPRVKDASVHKLQIGVQGMEIEQIHEAHFARSVVNVLIEAIFRGVSMRDAFCERSFHAFSVRLFVDSIKEPLA